MLKVSPSIRITTLGETESSSAEEQLDKGYPSPGRVHDARRSSAFARRAVFSTNSWNALVMPRKTYLSIYPSRAFGTRLPPAKTVFEIPRKNLIMPLKKNTAAGLWSETLSAYENPEIRRCRRDKT